MIYDWTPAAVLPNLYGNEGVEGDVIGIVPSEDERVVAFGKAHSNLAEFLSRFTDAFGVPLKPLVLIVRNDIIQNINDISAIASFRDLASMCAVPYGRAMASLYPNGGHRLSYANSFWLYPWMLGKDQQYLYSITPAMQGCHVVDQFHGQSSPDLTEKDLHDVDKPLFEALFPVWRRYYLGKRRVWKDSALFRSLNMAANAAQMPGGMDTTLYDLGRSASLWVSAFEILAHPRTAKSDLKNVYGLMESVAYLDRRMERKSYIAHFPSMKKKPWPRRPLSCWLYGELYKARNDFLHGNQVSARRLTRGLDTSLFWCAPGLYRMALTGFLGLKIDKSDPSWYSRQYQSTIERALLKVRKQPD